MPNEMPLNSMADAEAYLFERINYERTATIPYQEHDLKLQRMHDLLAQLGDPHLQLPCLHVAGTKGKGSTCAMLTSMLVANGYRVGTYTSPHFQTMLERLRFNGQLCDADVFVQLTRRIKPAVDAMDRDPDPSNHPTFFEILTALAFVYFREAEVDIAVLEVGLGGRLDSTNVCQPLVSIITSISLDHMAQLGHDLESIAREKAGIVKPSVPVVSGVRDQPARATIERIVAQQQSSVLTAGTEFDVEYDSAHSRFDYRQSFASPPCQRTAMPLAMLGAHQVANAGVALATLDVLRERGWHLAEDALRRGLRDAATMAPARIEIVSRNPAVVLDTAHNAASLSALLRVIDDQFADQSKTFVFGTTRGKDVEGMLALLAPRDDRLILTNYHCNPRSHDAASLSKILEAIPSVGDGGARRIRHEVIPRCGDAWRVACESVTANDLICVCGSFFLVAELEGLVRRS